MKVTMLSQIDFAFSGHKLCQAIARHTKHDIDIYTGAYHNRFQYAYKRQNIVCDRNRAMIQKRIDNSDIVHLKGDWPPTEGYLGLRIMHKPIVVSVSGSYFRKKEHGGYGTYEPWQYRDAVLLTAFTPDLLYDGFKTWTPHPVDCLGKLVYWQKRDTPVLLHMPSNPQNKGTDKVREWFRYFEDRGCVCKVTNKMPFNRALEMKKHATVFFDQFKVGFYGNSAIEAMAMGIPVANWIKPVYLDRLEDCPVITTQYDWIGIIERTLAGDLAKLSLQTRVYCDRVHSYQAVARQWDSLYRAI